MFTLKQPTPRPACTFEPLEDRRLLSSAASVAELLEAPAHSLASNSAAMNQVATAASVTPIKMKGTYSGQWATSTDFGSVKLPFTLQITYQKKTVLRAYFITGLGTGYFKLHGKTIGTNKFSFSYKDTTGGPGASVIIKVTGKISGGKVSGSASVDTGLTKAWGKFSGKRA